MDELEERRDSELAFVSAAYTPDEAWYNVEATENGALVNGVVGTVHRRLFVPPYYCNSKEEIACFVLSLSMTISYPEEDALQVHGRVDSERTSRLLLRASHKALRALLDSCQEMAQSCSGQESVLLLFNHVEQWLEEKWTEYLKEVRSKSPEITSERKSWAAAQEQPKILGRRLIYSHHIISKTKRSNIKDIASQYDLTGFMKVGWPGLLIVEGDEANCCDFYEEIRRWAWQYLVLRGEMQEEFETQHAMTCARAFVIFSEVEDMSIVASACREAGLESLFQTAMKIYEHDIQDNEHHIHGALILVDHMNDGKAYRKWLRKNSRSLDVSLVVKNIYADNDFTKRPTILVAFVGDNITVPSMLKRWRTSRVDINSHGKPCLERQMKIMSQGQLSRTPSTRVDWEDSCSENVNIEKDGLLRLLEDINGAPWVDIVVNLL